MNRPTGCPVPREASDSEIRIALDAEPPTEPGLYLGQVGDAKPALYEVRWSYGDGLPGNELKAYVQGDARFKVAKERSARWSRRIEIGG